MSCDNIQGNGEVAHKMIGAFARLKDPGLADWLEEHVVFPNSMVDRITPVTTDADRALLAEQFDVQDGWPVVCGRSPSGCSRTGSRTAVRRGGGRRAGRAGRRALRADEAPAAQRQPPGDVLPRLPQRLPVRARGLRRPAVHRFLLGYMDEEGTPSWPRCRGGPRRVQEASSSGSPTPRSATPSPGCARSSDRIPKWLLPVVRHQLATAARSAARRSWSPAGRATPRASTRRASRSTWSTGAATVTAGARQREDPLAFLRDRDLFGDLAEDARFTTEYLAALESLHAHGAHATLERWETA